VKPESDASLKEVAKCCNRIRTQALRSGHTDNVGTLTSNVSLSNQRAASVLKVLTTQYNVAAAGYRLMATGLTRLWHRTIPMTDEREIAASNW